ncbi:MAG: MarR family winged helix-turn-helix transcriptional regulator [Pseudomonadota bacterium]
MTDRALKPPSGAASSDRYRLGCVAFNLRRASRLVTRRYEDAMRPLDMKAFQFTALAALTGRGVIPLAVLADLFGMDQSTVSRNIRAMERKGWVRLTNDPKDGRKKHVAATDDGRAAFDEATPLWEQAQAETRKMMNGFDWDDQRSWLAAVGGSIEGEA